MRYLLLLATIFIVKMGIGQQNEAGDRRLSPKEFSIPSAPVFDVMGVTPSQINRTADIKDFKVDWSFRSWRINPNLAIQSQPIWEIFYNRKDLSRYQNASPLMRKLASVDVSVGSVQDDNGDRRLGYAVKINLIRSNDPLLAKELYLDIGERYGIEKVNLQKKLIELNKKLDTTTNIFEKPNIRNEIRMTEEYLFTLNSRRNNEINERAKVYISENWNTTSLDIAFGRVYAYQTDSSGSFRTLRLNRRTGHAGWINGSLGIGKRILLSGLLRSSWYSEELNFRIVNATTGEEQNIKAVAENSLFTAGVNIRYGGPYFTFFTEFLYEQKALKTVGEALGKVFNPPPGFTVVNNTVNWDVVLPNTFSFGGDWRFSRSVILNYGMRCMFNKDWKFTAFVPVVSLACLMR